MQREELAVPNRADKDTVAANSVLLRVVRRDREVNKHNSAVITAATGKTLKTERSGAPLSKLGRL